MIKDVKIVVLLSFVVSVLLVAPAYAHPGRTAGDGCHYCRTNCASWGEVQGARHCHNGGSIKQPVQNLIQKPVEAPVEIKKVVPVESKAVKVVVPPPTKIKEPAVLGIEEEVTFSPTPTPSPAFISSPIPKAIEKPISKPEPEEDAGSGVLWLLGLLVAGGVGVYMYKRK